MFNLINLRASDMPGLSRRRRATCGTLVGSHFSTGSWQCDCIVQLDARGAGRRDTMRWEIAPPSKTTKRARTTSGPARRAIRSYDIILSDLHMPGMSGEDLYRKIDHGWPHLAPRVVFVTAGHPSRGFQARLGGRPVPVVTKPYAREQLLQFIEEVVARDV